MRFRGGYNVLLDGRPGAGVKLLPEADTLHLPMRSRRFVFSEVRVADGQRVLPGQALAEDPGNYSVPLLAPRAGTVRLSEVEDHITLQDVAKVTEEPYHPDQDLTHIPKDMGSVGMKRYKLLTLGAWQFLCDAHSGELPDPFGTPRAVIVSTVHLEPFVARGDVQIHKRLRSFTRGLEHLQSLLEYQLIYLVMPEIKTEFALKVRELLRGYAWVQPVPIPLRYGLDNYAVLARHLGLQQEAEQPVWALGVAGLLAIDRALTLSRPCVVRIVSVGGPGVERPGHLKAMPGYPVRSIVEFCGSPGPVRIVNGGVLTGRAVEPGQIGLDAECDGLMVLPEHGEREREFLGFARPGWDRRSYSNCFPSRLRRAFRERFTTALRGERRPCIACGFCEEVCPAGIMPYLIHKYIYEDALEEAEQAGLHLCAKCGLCSFVCPSKIELREQLIEAEETIRTELHAEEVQA